MKCAAASFGVKGFDFITVIIASGTQFGAFSQSIET